MAVDRPGCFLVPAKTLVSSYDHRDDSKHIVS